MSNPEPETKHLEVHQYRPIGEQSMGKVIGTRYPVQIEALLNGLEDKQAFIREAVIKLLRDRGLLK